MQKEHFKSNSATKRQEKIKRKDSNVKSAWNKSSKILKQKGLGKLTEKNKNE